MKPTPQHVENLHILNNLLAQVDRDGTDGLTREELVIIAMARKERNRIVEGIMSGDVHPLRNGLPNDDVTISELLLGDGVDEDQRQPIHGMDTVCAYMDWWHDGQRIDYFL